MIQALQANEMRWQSVKSFAWNTSR